MSDADTSILGRLRLSAFGSVDLHHTHYRKDCADAVVEIELITAERDALRARVEELARDSIARLDEAIGPSLQAALATARAEAWRAAVEACRAAIHGERLTDAPDNDSDHAYNTALEHAVAALPLTPAPQEPQQ
jgi:hypothetical protein